MNLRDYARGKPCQVHSPLCCNDPERTVLAHFRMLGISGIGLKSPDILGAWCCDRCHEYVDQKTQAGKPERDLLLLKGVARTINELVKAEVVTW